MTTTTQAVSAAASSDFTALATNLSILIAFITAAVMGVKAGIKKHNEANRTQSMAPDQAKVVAATLMENITLSEWSQTNRETREALLKVCQAVAENTAEMKELRHALQLDLVSRR